MTTIQAALRKIIVDSFSIEELALLCTDIGIDPDNVLGPDKGKEFYLGQVIDFTQRRGLLDALVKRVKAARPHLQFDVFSLDAASISGWLYGDAHLEVDRKLFQDIRDRLRACVQFVRDHDFARPFDIQEVEAIYPFVRFCEEPESEFINPDVNRARLLLRDAARMFNTHIVWDTYGYHFSSGKMVQSVPFDPYKDTEFMMALAHLTPEERDQRIALQEERRIKSFLMLNDLSRSLWSAYYAFVQEGRRQLGVA